MKVNQPLEIIVGELLNEKELTVAVVETCTGGLISSRLTRLPGSSKYFIGSVVAYDDHVKTSLLRVDPKTLQQYGAVSKQAVEEMAVNVRKLLLTDIGIAVSGIAGPSGGTTEKPVGLTWISLATKDAVISKKFLWKGNREENTSSSSTAALEMLKEYLESLK